jgi:hypothetical protein
MANITVYITLHNYGQFLPEAIDSITYESIYGARIFIAEKIFK